eukprot:CAMPEP_0117575088 /NCGR_PEP_ID=MMETSP0784-20121206/62008_1 /TAXON_ID=39447 /ORGANISM="" /LENGTH=527 /DNA_ID=CAMNT_0005374111 /DNA_START=98 /DNA_END=1681 /DNA_ORIENTATION=-
MNGDVGSAPQLIFEAHGYSYRRLSSFLGQDFQGLSQAARTARQQGHISSLMATKLCRLDTAFSLLRHVSSVKNDRLFVQIDNELGGSSILAGRLLHFAEDVRPSTMAELIIYGRDTCGMCVRFKAQCDSAGLVYKFVAIDEPAGRREMSNKLRSASWFKGGSFGLPLVDVYGAVKQRPSIEEVRLAKESSLSAPQVDDVKAQFRTLDSNGDGMLSFQEMKGLLKQLNPTFSNRQLQALFCAADSDQNGVIEMDEFLDFILAGKKREPAIDIERPLGTASSDAVRADWKEACVSAHNGFRKEHGAGDLGWNDECYVSAKKQADACQEKGGMFHDNCEGPSGRHGQNIFWCSAPGSSALRMVQAWYDEMVDPGYDFSSPGFTSGTGHFTQVVWKGSQGVGMALSEDGRFAVANYFPAGNVMGRFREHVLPRGSTYTPEEDEPPPPPPMQGFQSEPAPGAVTATSMTPELEAAFEGCPFPFKDKAAAAFAEGDAIVTVERSADGNMRNMQVTIKKGCSTSRMRGSWGLCT